MGYTRKTWDIIKPLLKDGMVVCDLGAQNDFTEPELPFVSKKYKQWDIKYACIDVNGKNNAVYHDLGTPLERPDLFESFDIVVDAGTKEHVKNLETAFYNQDYLCKKGGLMYCENPKVGSWPDHGHHYFTIGFYTQLALKKGYQIVRIDEHPCNTSDDGWEIICVLRK